MAIVARDLPSARLKRWGYHAGVGLITALAVWSALTWHALSSAASGAVSAARAKAEEDSLAADAVAAECGLPAFSDEVSLRRFPMQRQPYPTKRESACLQKVTDARGNLINDRIDLDRAVPVADERAAVAKSRLIVAGVLAAVFLAGVYLLEVHPLLRFAGRRPGA